MKRTLKAAPLITGGAVLVLVGWLLTGLWLWMYVEASTADPMGYTDDANPLPLIIGLFAFVCGLGAWVVAAKETVERIEEIHERYFAERRRTP